MSHSPNRSLSRLDPRNPLLIDTHALPRRPGARRVLSRVVPAPADLGIDVIGVPEGTDITLDLRLESVSDGVLVSGAARAQLAGKCVHCLDPLRDRLCVQVRQLYLYAENEAGHWQAETDDEIASLSGSLLDLEPVVRDAVVLGLPLRPVCRENCPGLCPTCGVRLADVPDHQHRLVDPRWTALSGLFGDAGIEDQKSDRDDKD